MPARSLHPHRSAPRDEPSRPLTAAAEQKSEHLSAGPSMSLVTATATPEPKGDSRFRARGPSRGGRQLGTTLKELQQILEAASSPQCLWFGASLRLFCNRQLRTLLSASESLGSSKALRRKLWTAMGSTITTCRETRRQLKRVVAWPESQNASAQLLRISCRPILEHNSKFHGVLCTVRVCARPSTAIRASRRVSIPSSGLRPSLPQQICDLMPVPSWWVCAAKGTVLLANQLGLDTIGAPSAASVSFFEQIAPADRKRLSECIKQSFGPDASWSCEVRLVGHGLPARWHRLDGRKTCVGENSLSAWLVMGIDIDRLRAREARAEASCCVRKNFLTVASHELRTPLTTLQLNLQIAAQRLKKCEDEGPQKKSLYTAIARSLHETHRLEEVIGDCLDVSRIRSGKLHLQRQKTMLKQVIDEVMTPFVGPLSETNSRIKVEVPEALWGDWDSARLGQIFFNLFSNVLKHAAGSCTTIRATRAEQGGVRIDVSDDGPGINSAYHRSVFLPFERATAIRGVSGLGLGLYLSQQIVREHGGSMGLCPHHTSGAHFILFLPVHSTLPDSIATPSPAPRVAGRQRPARLTVPSNRHRFHGRGTADITLD